MAGGLAPGYAKLVPDPLLTVNSLPPIALGVLKEEDELEFGIAQETRPFPHPQQGLLDALTWLSSDDW